MKDIVRLGDSLLHVVGVVEHGLFLNMADDVLISSDEGVFRAERQVERGEESMKLIRFQ